MNDLPILLIPEKTDAEFEDILSAWTGRGGQTRRLGKYWVKDEEIAVQKIAIYGNLAFAFVLAQIYDAELVSPDDALVARLDRKWTKREVVPSQIGLMKHRDFPVFIKPVIPKLFIAGVFQNLEKFAAATKDLEKNEDLLVSNIITIQAEARAFVIDGIIADIALYEGNADLNTGREFLRDFLVCTRNELPNVLVVDIAFSEALGWFVLEFNACWGAGLNGCSAGKVIDCIINATINR